MDAGPADHVFGETNAFSSRQETSGAPAWPFNTAWWLIYPKIIITHLGNEHTEHLSKELKSEDSSRLIRSSPFPPPSLGLPSHGPSFSDFLSRFLPLTEYITARRSPSFASSISPSLFFTYTFCNFTLHPGRPTFLSSYFYHGANNSRICWELAVNACQGESVSALQVSLSIIDRVLITHERYFLIRKRKMVREIQ